MPDIYVGIIIGALAMDAIWLLVKIFKKKQRPVGKLTIDMTGEGQATAIDLSRFTDMLTAKTVLLEFELILPEEEHYERKTNSD